MKTNTKILIIFLTLVVLIFSRLAINHGILSRILANTIEIKDVEAPLEMMSEQVIGYDAMLTGEVQLALLNAQAGNYQEVKVHKEKYDAIAFKLDNLLKRDARLILNRSNRSLEVKNWIDYDLIKLDKINAALIDLEAKAFTAMEQKDVNKAYALIVGGDYQRYKADLYQTYSAWSDIEHEMTMIVRNGIITDSRNLIYATLVYSIIIILVLIALMILARIFMVEKNKKFELLYATSSDALMTLEPPTWNFTSGNQAAIKLFGLPDEKQLMALSPNDLSPEKQPDGQLSATKSKQMIDQALADGKSSFKWVHKKYMGANFNADVLLSRVKANGKYYLQATVREID